MRENPVREAAFWVLRRGREVALDQAGLEKLAEVLLPLPDPAWVRKYHFQGEEDLTLRYLLVLDALNFCFWPGKRWSVSGPDGERLMGYYALSYALCKVAQDFPEFFEPKNLAAVTEEGLRDVLGSIPLLSWRVAAAKEVGRVLLRQGSAAAFFALAQGSAQRLVELLTAHLPMFRDAAVYWGRWVPFHKRAQILVADLWGTFGGRGFGEFFDLFWLTAFADYKLPQVLWAYGAMRFSPVLSARILAGKIIPRGSPEEVEIRVATVVAVERLLRILRASGREILPFQVDWLLWNLSQGLALPHHRTLTWAY